MNIPTSNLHTFTSHTSQHKTESDNVKLSFVLNEYHDLRVQFSRDGVESKFLELIGGQLGNVKKIGNLWGLIEGEWRREGKVCRNLKI